MLNQRELRPWAYRVLKGGRGIKSASALRLRACRDLLSPISLSYYYPLSFFLPSFLPSFLPFFFPFFRARANLLALERGIHQAADKDGPDDAETRERPVAFFEEGQERRHSFVVGGQKDGRGREGGEVGSSVRLVRRGLRLVRLSRRSAPMQGDVLILGFCYLGRAAVGWGWGSGGFARLVIGLVIGVWRGLMGELVYWMKVPAAGV